ncbi:MAG: DHH family phosphoesterase, partial [Clostridia bacterium]|nr:DHH family phosphoesterase [Clostridia bacterium]
VDPFRQDDTSKFKTICGVMVALKLAAALSDEYETVLEEYGDIAAIGTVADVMPCVGENRAIIRRGLEIINSGSVRPGLAALIEKTGRSDGFITSSDIAFMISPRLNAAGRMDSPDVALKLLLCEDESQAEALADRLCAENDRRRAGENVILAQVADYLKQHPEVRYDPVILIAVSGDEKSSGVVGLAAARLCERFGRPCAVAAVGPDGFGRGSCRSVEGFSIFGALEYADSALRELGSSVLSAYGGHELAAGFSVNIEPGSDPSESLAPLRDALVRYSRLQKPVYPVLNIDSLLRPEKISLQLAETLYSLEPFGKGNELPVFEVDGVKITRVDELGKEKKHLRLAMSGEHGGFEAMLFNTPLSSFAYSAGDAVDVAVTVEVNVWNGRRSAGVKVIDMRPAGAGGEDYFASMLFYDRFRSGSELTDRERAFLLPDRSLITAVYKALSAGYTGNAEKLCAELGMPDKLAARVRLAIEALIELDLVTNEGCRYAAVPEAGRKNLSDSDILSSLGYAE